MGQKGEKRASRSGSRAPVAPRTKHQRLVRARELTERMDRRLEEIEEMGKERAAIFDTLNREDEVTLDDIAKAIDRSEQLVHKAVKKHRERAEKENT